VEQTLNEVQEQLPGTLINGSSPATTDSIIAPAAAVAPQACATCGTTPAADPGPATPSAWVYAIGTIATRFPSLSVEKEFAQATSRENTAGLTDRQALHAVLSRAENRYLARQLCFVLSIEGLDTYLLRPRDQADLGLLVEAIRPNPSPQDLDVVIGARGPIAPPQMCNGLSVPIVLFDQIYSFPRDEFIKSIPTPEKMTAEKFAPAAEELFDRILQMTDNAGATDEHRALNYLAVRYQAIYSKAAEYFAQNYSLTGVKTQASVLSGARRLREVVFSYTNRATEAVEKSFVRVDMTDEFPFLVTKLSPYYDR
jgi:hypothetical protein